VHTLSVILITIILSFFTLVFGELVPKRVAMKKSEQVARFTCGVVAFLAAVMRAADLVLCRAGASTISELTALGVPALIVPSPYVTNNHQEKNARVLENAGGAAVLLEKDCSGQALFQAACGILHDGARRASMERAMSALGIRDATERIYQTVLEICQ